MVAHLNPRGYTHEGIALQFTTSDYTAGTAWRLPIYQDRRDEISVTMINDSSFEIEMAALMTHRRMPDVTCVTASTIALSAIVPAPGADNLESASTNVIHNTLGLLRRRATRSTPAIARSPLLMRSIIARLRVTARGRLNISARC